MLKRTLTTLTLAMAITNGAVALAQEPPSPPQAPQAPRRSTPQVMPAPQATPTPRPAPRVYVSPREDSNAQSSPLTMKVARNARIAVSSRMVNINITGIDGDTLEATAVGDDGTQPVRAQTTGDENNPKISIYVPLTPAHPSERDVNLNIKLPRYAMVESVESLSGDIQVHGIDAPVAVNTTNGTITVVQVASLKASTRHGEITAREIKGDAVARSTNGDLTFENIGGTIDAVATNGSLNVRNAQGDLRANLTVGEVTAHCVKGRAEVNTVSGDIHLVGVGGDVEAVTTSGEVGFTGRMRANGRYKLKSISGDIEMHIQSDAPGFTATLTTYSGDIETEFPLKIETPVSGGSINRRINGRFGDGGAQIVLDSFSGSVKLAKAPNQELNDCK